MRYIEIIFTFFVAISCHAQSEDRKIILMRENNIPTQEFHNEQIDSLYNNYSINTYSPKLWSIAPIHPLVLLSYCRIPIYSSSSAEQGIIYQGHDMTLSGMVAVTAYPGMMNKDEGMLGFSFRKEKLHFQVSGIVNKYGYYNSLLRQLGIFGQLTYQLSSPFSFTAFAYYYGNNVMPLMPNGDFMTPSMLGYYEVSRFGGYINYNPSEHFGIQMGGQVVERMGPKNHYEMEPIVTPYINVGHGKKKIGLGLPVGQILYGIFGK